MTPQATAAAFFMILGILGQAFQMNKTIPSGGYILDAATRLFMTLAAATGLVMTLVVVVFVNCLVTGGCDIFAWTLVAIVVLALVFTIINIKTETLVMRAPAPHSKDEGTYQTVHTQQVYYGKDVPGVLPFGETPP